MSTAVLGGGLSGLSAAYYLRQRLDNPITLFEASNRLGGWIQSNLMKNDITFEQGARTIRPRGPAAQITLKLIEDLGLSDQVNPILSSQAAAKNRMIYAGGKLHTLPSSIFNLFKRQEPFSKPLIKYLLHDLFAAKKVVKDESIYDFVKRRFGSEFADYLISPLICGICAGNANEISVNFLMKNLFEYEQNHGSISRGLVHNFFKKEIQHTDMEDCKLIERARKEKWVVYSLKEGVESLPKALETYLRNNNVPIELNSKIVDLEMYPGHNVLIQLECGKTTFSDYVISSIPAEQLGNLVQKQHPELAELLHNIKCVTVGVVNLHYDKKLISNEGFGFLVPPKEKLPILGVTYDTCCFPKGNNTVLTVMMGGSWFERLFGTKPEKGFLLSTAKEQVANILGINEEPVQQQVSILDKCIPQYRVGHKENLEKINNFITSSQLPLHLCGASYHGVGINDVILSGRSAVKEFSNQ